MPKNNTKESQIIRLSVEDQRAFAEAILNPPPPNDAMKRAASAYRKMFDERRSKADFEAFDRLMRRDGGEQPRPDDTLE